MRLGPKKKKQWEIKKCPLLSEEAGWRHRTGTPVSLHALQTAHCTLQAGERHPASPIQSASSRVGPPDALCFCTCRRTQAAWPRSGRGGGEAGGEASPLEALTRRLNSEVEELRASNSRLQVGCFCPRSFAAVLEWWLQAITSAGAVVEQYRHSEDRRQDGA